MHDITPKTQHKVGFVNTQKIVGFKSFSTEVYFLRENLDEISPCQIGYCEHDARTFNIVTIELTQSALGYLAIEELGLWYVQHFSLSIPSKIRHGIFGLDGKIDIRIPIYSN